MNTKIKRVSMTGVLFFVFFVSIYKAYPADVSVEIQENIDLLIRTNGCVECNLAGADLNRLNLSGADLRGADLTNATFFLADLSDANLSGALLRGTQFGGADLADADLRGADLRGVKIAGAYLVGCKLDGSFADVPVSDDNAGQEFVEKKYIPDDSVPKKVPENKQVNIAERRDFGPVPPQTEPSPEISQKQTQAAGPPQMTAPPKKTVSPVKEIVLTSENDDIAESTDNMISQAESINISEPQNKNVDVAVENGGNNTIALINSEGKKQRAAESDEKQIVPFEERRVIASAAEQEIKDDSDQTAQTDQQITVMEDGLPISDTQDKSDTDTPVVNDNLEAITELPNEGNDNKQETVQDEAGQEAITAPAENTENDVSQQMLDTQERLKKYKKCYNCNLQGIDFSGRNLNGADLEGSDFSGANLEKADLKGANLKGVSFRDANLKSAKFNRADLYKADFTGADLTGAEFKEAIIDETNFENAIGYGSMMLN